MSQIVAGIAIPDSALANTVTDLIRREAGPQLFNHSRRVFLFGSLSAEAKGLSPDPELLYTAAMFHDLGLVEGHRTSHQRFEVDGADAAQELLLAHGRSTTEARTAWLAIALHTTPGIPAHLEPEIACVAAGVEADVLGIGLPALSQARVAEVVEAHPRPGFKDAILHAFYEGVKERPETTFGTVNDDVLAHFDPSFTRTDFTAVIRDSAWPE